MESRVQYFACLCRTCMNKAEACSYEQQWPSIFDTIEEYSDLRIAELLSDAVPQIVVQLNDELPMKICTECLEQLLSVYRFQEMCVQSDKEIHKLLSKEQTVLKTPMFGEAITGETQRNDADLLYLNELRCTSTPQNLQQPSTLEPLAEVTVQTIEPEAAESRADDNLQDNNELLEECMDEFEEFIKNEPNEVDKANADKDTMHSTSSVTKDTTKELEDDQEVNVTSSRHNCHLCNKSYKRREYLRKHLNDHKKKANNRKEYCYACHLCNESYKKQQYLSRHLSLEHPNRSSHTQKSNLAKQPATHAEDKPYQCPLCPLRFSSPSHMESHKTTSHERIKPHKCDICGRKFRLQRVLIKHKRKHSKEKPHKCDLCEKRFAHKRQLTVHKRQHTGKKPYKCKYCKLAFITIGARTNHLRRHLGKNIHRCTFCPLAFPSAVKLSYHLTTHNNEDPVTRERNLKALHEEVAKLESKLLKESAEPQSEEEQQQHQNLSNKEIGQLSTEPDDFREFIKNDPNETDKSNTKYSVGDTMHSTISVTRDEETPIEPEDQQVNVTQDYCSVFVMNEPIEDDDNSNTEYSDADTMQSTISVTKNEPTEQRNEKVKASSARHKCHLCNKSFKNDKILRAHLNAHKIKANNQKEYCYSCHLCSQSYKKEWILARHVKIEHSIVLQRSTCNFCNKKLTTPSVLRQHIRIHTGERPYSCTECGQSFAMKNSLTQHRSNHHSCDKPHKCPYCPRGYNVKSALKRHSIIHEEVKGHQCDICLKRFGLKCDLTTHNKLYHSKEKPHKCEFCGKRFIFIRELQTHNRNHTGEKPYKCKYCERGFASRGLLSQHLRSHLGKNIYRCELCPLAFPLHPELRLHLASHKNEDPEKRERNLKALQEEEAKLELKPSKERAKRKSKEKQQQPKLSKNKLTRIVERKRRTNSLKSYNCYFD